MVLGTSNMTSLVRGHVRRSAITGGLRLIVHGNVRVGMRGGRMRIIRLSIRCRRIVLGSRIRTSPVVFAMAIVTACWLWAVWNYLHSSGNSTSWAAASSRIRRGCWSAKSFVKLLEKRATYVVSRNMHSIRHTHNDEGAFTG